MQVSDRMASVGKRKPKNKRRKQVALLALVSTMIAITVFALLTPTEPLSVWFDY